tara:strand:+ start:503 stop:721 length:219 start_codon:yes stop_codon:yes gene_type:complete
MILLEKFTQDGVKIPIALPINSIMEATPNAYQPDHSWIKYSDGQSVRSMVVVGTVEELVQRIHNIKRSYMGY